MAHEDDNLHLLTPEERAGMDEDHGEEDLDEEDDDDLSGADDADKADEPQAKADKPEDDPAPGRDGGEPEDEPQARDEPLPLLQVQEDAEATAKLAALEAKADEIEQKVDDGDLTFAEGRKALRQLAEEREQIRLSSMQADFARKHNEAQINARWEADVGTFLEAHPEIDTSKPLLVGAFDQVVRQVTAETMQAGKNPGRADLEKAYKLWADQLGIKPPAAKQEQAKADPAPTGKKRPPAPPTLANVPAASIVDTDSGKWTKLDSYLETDPLKFETELAKLSVSDREAYLAAQ